MRLVLFLCGSLMLSAQSSPNVESVGARIGGTAYPRMAMDHQGATVKLTGPAMRIVSLIGGSNDYLYQIVPPERIVGVTKSAYDEGFSPILDKVIQYHPAVVKDFDSIMALKPDLVITTDSMMIDVGGKLREAGIPVFGIITTPATLDQIGANVQVLGYVTGADEGASKELKRFQSEVARIAAQCSKPHGQPRIYGVSMTGFSYGDHTLFQDMMRVLNATNVAAVGGLHTYQQVDLPTIASWNPDWVFTWAVPGQQERELHRWLEDPNLSKTSASQNRRIIVLKSTDILPLSPSITGFMNEIAKATCPKD